MSEKDKMIDGKIYDPSDNELFCFRQTAHNLCTKYNQLLETDIKQRTDIINQLFPNKKKNIYIQGPIYVDYGFNTYIGENFYANFNLVILDICPIYIGDNVFIGPNVSIVNALHPMHYLDRNLYINSSGKLTDKEYGGPIKIGSNCWIATGVTISANVNIGEGCVIGANSVVIDDIPANSFAAGNPCKVIRKITKKDRINL